MRVCVIFRGDNVRQINGSRNYVDILKCWNNIKQTIVDDLINNGHICETAFITYPSKIIDEIMKTISPNHMRLFKKETQIKNFGDVISFALENRNNYDRFLILRCDFQYRIPITNWPKWNEYGIFIVNKDVHWPSTNFYADIVFMVDADMLDIFNTSYRGNIFYDTIHGLGKYLYENNISFHLIYDGYYHMDNHILHSLASLEEEPDINNPKKIDPISDISQWN